MSEHVEFFGMPIHVMPDEYAQNLELIWERDVPGYERITIDGQRFLRRLSNDTVYVLGETPPPIGEKEKPS